MKHRFRFLVDDVGCPEITGEEFHHLGRVLRLRSGDMVEVTDGSGRWAEGTLGPLTSAGVTVNLTGPPEAESPPRSRIILGLGALKPQDFYATLPGLCELGLWQINVFLQPGTEKQRISTKVFEKSQKIILASVKQCKRAYLPQLRFFDSLESLLSEHALLNVVFGDPGGCPLRELNLSKECDEMLAIVGGEKGLLDEELAMLTYAQPLRLSPHILRATTAGLAIAAVLTHEYL